MTQESGILRCAQNDNSISLRSLRFCTFAVNKKASKARKASKDKWDIT
jgi:hypothetical protein